MIEKKKESGNGNPVNLGAIVTGEQISLMTIKPVKVGRII